MKVLKKMLAVAVSVATMAMSVSAFAATYDAKTNSVAMTAEELTADGKVPAAITGQMTVVVVPKNLGGASITESDIYYINQEEFGTKFNEIIMKTVASDGTVISNGMGLCKPLAEKDENGDDKKDKDGNLIINPKLYEVRIGGTNLKDKDNKNYTVSFDITVEGNKIIYGDVDFSENVDATDANLVLRSVAKVVSFNDDEKKAADVDGSTVVDATDANYILRYVAKVITSFPVEAK